MGCLNSELFREGFDRRYGEGLERGKVVNTLSFSLTPSLSLNRVPPVRGEAHALEDPSSLRSRHRVSKGDPVPAPRRLAGSAVLLGRSLWPH